VRLSEPMTDALTAAQHAPLRRVHLPGPGRPPWPAAPATLRALIRHGLLEQGTARNRDGWPVDTWSITEAGRTALHPPPRERVHRAKFLAHSVTEHGYLQPAYTDDPSRAMRDDRGAIERVDPAEVSFLLPPSARAWTTSSVRCAGRWPTSIAAAAWISRRRREPRAWRPHAVRLPAIA
jgi:hypothetical protein